ncbi:saccharopine dehydrogenase NADP-binding domain-containing protein [bacterium]|nr:saccharopine dehydrogenase NADP-binding domain-containing protein [bacterium]
MRIHVLGGGLVGGPMARDLAGDDEHDVTVVDRDPAVLEALAAQADVATRQADLASPAAVREVIADADLVVGAVPGHLGFRTLEAVIDAGRNVVDIAFFPEDPFALDALARERGVVAVVDCGVFPGMGSALIGRLHRKLDRLERVLVLVGGLPEVREWPWEYKAVFSPVDVIEEYTRPARYIEHGREVVRPALSDPELVHLPGVGTLEAFNTDGLRTLVRTIGAPHMKEKTLRYPGHAEKMALLRECGFFGTEPVDVGGQAVRPVDLTGRLLFPMWEMHEGEGDLTVMRIEVEGERKGQRLRYVYDLLDHADLEHGVSSMARTTGYTATMTARLIAAGRFTRVGISPPEYLGAEFGLVDALREGLEARGIFYREQVEVVS